MMEKVVIILVVGLAAGYLIRRYLKDKKAGGGCGCSNGSCDMKSACSDYSVKGKVSDGRQEMKTAETGTCSAHTRTPDS